VSNVSGLRLTTNFGTKTKDATSRTPSATPITLLVDMRTPFDDGGIHVLAMLGLAGRLRL